MDEKNFLNEYERSIYEFLADLDQKGHLKVVFTIEEAERFVKLMDSFRILIGLCNRLTENFKNLEEYGLKLEYNQLASFYAHMCPLFPEKLKYAWHT